MTRQRLYGLRDVRAFPLQTSASSVTVAGAVQGFLRSSRCRADVCYVRSSARSALTVFLQLFAALSQRFDTVTRTADNKEEVNTLVPSQIA